MKFLILMLLLPSLAACTSLYSRSYTQLIDPSTVAQAPKAPTPQAVILVRSENLQKDVQSMREKMYVPIGYSSFSGEPESEEVLIAFAERIGASAVLLSSTFTLSISYAEAKAGGDRCRRQRAPISKTIARPVRTHRGLYGPIN